MTRIEEINKQIGELAKELVSLINPSEEEITTAIEMLTDDPYNDIQSIVTPEDDIGIILICQQILDDREFDLLEEV